MGQHESATLGDDLKPENLKARSLDAVAQYISSGAAKKIVVLTGAGISTAAGIPDFRSPGTGLYDNLKRLNLPYPEAVFDIDFFKKKPQPFYVLAKELYPGKFHPTICHAFISLLAKKKLLSKLFTQNIDCLERQAGVPADLIVEAHGSFATQRCIECKSDYPEDEMKTHVEAALVPICKAKKCGGLVKPDIVFFGEGLPMEFTWNCHLAKEADMILVMGTSLTVYPFAGVADLPPRTTPRVLFNREQVGSLGKRPDDVIELGTCDQGVRKLAKLLGWSDELNQHWRDIVGWKEAERQTALEDTYEEEIEEFDDEIIGKMTEELEGLDLTTGVEKDARDDLLETDGHIGYRKTEEKNEEKDEEGAGRQEDTEEMKKAEQAKKDGGSGKGQSQSGKENENSRVLP